MTQQSHYWSFTRKNWKQRLKHLYTNVQILVHISTRWKPNVYQLMNGKQNATWPQSGLELSHKKGKILSPAISWINPHTQVLSAVISVRYLLRFLFGHMMFIPASYSPSWRWRLVALGSTAQTSSPLPPLNHFWHFFMHCHFCRHTIHFSP